MRLIPYYSRVDSNKEPLGKLLTNSRYTAAKFFAARKSLTLREFLTIYTVPKDDKDSSRND